MHGIRIYSFVVAFLTFGLFLLALPEEGFSGIAPVPISCCQGDGECIDSTEGPFLCQVDNVVEDALCNQDTDLCELIPVVSNIPTLNEWGLIAMAGILGIAGFLIIRRRKAAA
jgi:hypothetical protein